MQTSPTLQPLAPDHSSQRRALRLIGGVMLVAGIPFMLVGLINFFGAFGGSGSADLFWCVLVGLLLISYGARLLKLGYLGSIARYVASEAAPVAAETTDYLAANTTGAVRTVTRAVASGLREGMAGALTCAACGAGNDGGARFCNQCGAHLAAPATCACGAANAAGARFCQRCGKALPVAG